MVAPDKVNTVVHVERTLARALDMYDTRTTAEGLANYVSEHVNLPRAHYFEDAPHAIHFLVHLAIALTPPDDLRMSFRERPLAAAKSATPWTYGDALSTIMEIGWGNLSLPGADTVREAGESIRNLLSEKAQETALQLLNRWETLGFAIRL